MFTLSAGIRRSFGHAQRSEPNPTGGPARHRPRGGDIISESGGDYFSEQGGGIISELGDGFPRNLHTFRLSAAYSYNRTKILHIANNPPQLGSLNVTLFAHQAQTDLVAAVPHDKIILTNDWKLARAHALARVTRFGRYVEASTVASGDRAFGAKWVTDLDIGYDLTEHMTLSAGANNLFDVYPDKHGLIAFDGSGAYGNFAPFGLSGGFYYGRLSMSF
jgi:iron complex outermembrane receptor protein